MSRFLAPLFVLALLVVVVVRHCENPHRQVIERSIEATCQTIHRGGNVEQVTAEIDAYLEAYPDDVAERFGLWAYTRTGSLAKALEVARRMGPEAAHEVGGTMLHALAFADREGEQTPLGPAPVIAVILAEGSGPRAEAAVDYLRRHLADTGIQEVVTPLFAALMIATEPGRARLTQVLRERDAPRHEMAAAFLALRAQPYPEREKDLEAVLTVLDGAWDQERSFVWPLACLSIGRSEDPQALTRLRLTYEKLRTSEDPKTRLEATLAAAGLLAAGDEHFTNIRLGPGVSFRSPAAAVWHQQALLHRLAVGDMRMIPYLENVWDNPATMRPLPEVRSEVGSQVLLRDKPPPSVLPIDSWLRDLSEMEPTSPGPALAAAYEFRLGSEGSYKRLLERIAAATERQDPDRGLRDARTPSGVIQGLRALYLYGRQPAPPTR